MRRVTVSVVFFFFVAAFAAAQTTVTGKVSDQDGKPMLKAGVVLLDPANMQVPLKFVRADRNGSFKIAVDSTGVWLLEFVGVDHEFRRVAFNFSKHGIFHLDVRLATYKYLPSFNGAKVVGNFNDWDDKTAFPMKKQPDSTYAAVIKCDSDSVSYRLLGVAQGDLVEGTQADYYLYDNYSGYNSVVTPKNGEVKIVFDPSKLVRSDKPSAVVFEDSNSVEAKFAGVYDEMQNNEKAFVKYVRAFEASGKNPREFHYDWSAEENSLRTRVAEAKTTLLRKELMLAYLQLGGMAARLDTSLARKCVYEISPASDLWAMMPIVTNSLLAARLTKKEHEEYIQKLIDENPSAGVKTTVLVSELILAKRRNDETAVAKYYSIIVNRYGNTQMAKIVKARFSPNVAPEVGQQVPPFSVPSLQDPKKMITSVSLEGRNYLMDFWATWCGPCVAEMGNLQAAYKKFKSRDFTILSLSLDQTRQDVVKFREKKWKMPWLQSFLGMNSQNRVLKDFDVMSIPNPILVDSTGKVLAVGVELRGAQLEKTLEKYLGK